MCQFFSFVSDGQGKVYYFNYKQRQEIKDREHDSHTSIADYYGFKGEKEDLLNKWEYNPFSKKLTKDRIVVKEEYPKIEKWISELDFKEIVPNIHFDKSFTNPLTQTKKEIELDDLILLRRYVELWDQLWDQLGCQLRDQLWDQLGCQLWDQLRDQIYSFGTSFISDFKFKDEKQEELVETILELWARGLIPFYDKANKEAYLFGNKKVDILFKEKI